MSAFSKSIAELWQALDLGNPPPFGVPEARMRVEGATVKLRASPDGQGIRAAVSLGALPEGPAGDRALSAVLERALGLLLLNPSVIRCEKDGRELLVEGHVAASAHIQRRISMIEAVLEAKDTVQSILVMEGGVAQTGAAAGYTSGGKDAGFDRRDVAEDEDDGADEIMIFRP
ncbi:MAG: hypothetical protein AAGF48_15475 [Pseudomonadota bacterium]